MRDARTNLWCSGRGSIPNRAAHVRPGRKFINSEDGGAPAKLPEQPHPRAPRTGVPLGSALALVFRLLAGGAAAAAPAVAPGVGAAGAVDAARGAAPLPAPATHNAAAEGTPVRLRAPRGTRW